MFTGWGGDAPCAGLGTCQGNTCTCPFTVGPTDAQVTATFARCTGVDPGICDGDIPGCILPTLGGVMGRLALAAKVTQVPSIWLSEQSGPEHGVRKTAIDGLVELGRRARARGVQNFVALFRLAQDVAASGFGARQVLYERFFFGPPEMLAATYYDGKRRRPLTLERRVRPPDAGRAG